MFIRTALVLFLISILGFQAMRSASVRGQSVPAAKSLWPAHPDVQLMALLTEIGARAREGKSLTPEMIVQVDKIASDAPLAPEPFLIKGALSQLEGKDKEAEALFTAAVQRDPRSAAGRYFLAERFLRTGRLQQALVEMAALARLIPASSAQFAPALAQFAENRGAVPALRSFFQSSPEFEAPVLSELARSEKNADLIFALWSGRFRKGDADWRQLLVGKLIEQGQYTKAQAAWRRSTGQTRGGDALFNPQFQSLEAPPPFNWTFSTQGGLAEPTGDGGLKVVYYGRQDAVLAEQMLALKPGQYQLALNLSGTPADQASVRWTVTCLPGKQTLANLPLRAAQPVRRIGTILTVSQSCPAQWLRLEGELGEFPRSAELTIRELQLGRAGKR